MAEKDGGISCSKYLKSRKSSSLEALRKCPPKEKVANMSRQKHNQEPEKRTSLNTLLLEFSHGDKKANPYDLKYLQSGYLINLEQNIWLMAVVYLI